MGWVYRVPEHHEHDMPNISYRNGRDKIAKVGDRWACTCKKVFVVSNATYVADQKDGDFVRLEWREYIPFPPKAPAWDSGHRSHRDWEIR